ncbi:chorismate synthase [Aromatoleum toluolicum]|uniref:Chorismate synthase n=1 Tax=Aromatoleum toluolicum TaxID=90060 RepID=A0ABX1NCL2_9RHOO|nr:chorismate synthase [Aromatoleum toluolicum]NMF96955.1 chorismate synthase [Aromatoleum toluolicum]
MAGNSFGKLFRVTSFGESHGPAIGCIVDGCPPGLPIDAAGIQRALDRRRPRVVAALGQRREPDQVEILSGVFEGRTTGHPIALLIRNRDVRWIDYSRLDQLFRPGHAEYTYWHKYGINDHRGGGRASARETAVRVAAGAIASAWLGPRYGVEVRGWLSRIGSLELPFRDASDLAASPRFVADARLEPLVEALLADYRESGDSVGAEVALTLALPEALADRAPAWRGLLGKALMSVNAVKAVEFDEAEDALQIRVAVKPTPSVHLPRRTIDKAGRPAVLLTRGKRDPCVGIRAVPILEAMVWLGLADVMLRERAVQAGALTGGG